MRSTRPKRSRGERGTPATTPTDPSRPRYRFRTGPIGLTNRFLEPTLVTAVRWSVALVGLWLVAMAADDPPSYRVENLAIPDSLTGRAGDPTRGERIVRDPDKATCLICHAIPIEGEPDPGNIGPPLNGVASRYTAGELRLRLVDPKRLNPDTVMPSYYTRDGLNRVTPEYRGRPIYSAGDIEDVVAYLLTLTGG